MPLFPGNWAITKYDSSFESNKDFLSTCIFKWSFNIKPDIVIHTDVERAICIEAKYGSGEGQYPGTEHDKRVFRRRNMNFVKQTSLQRHMMTELLGVETQFLFLVKNDSGGSDTHRTISWRRAFSCMKIENCPPFAADMLANLGVSI